MARKKQFIGRDRVIYFRVPQEAGKNLEKRAAERWMSLSDYVRQLIRKGLEKELEQEGQ